MKKEQLRENASCDEKAQHGIYPTLKEGETRCNCLSCRRIDQIRVLLQPVVAPIREGFWGEKYGT